MYGPNDQKKRRIEFYMLALIKRGYISKAV